MCYIVLFVSLSGPPQELQTNGLKWANVHHWNGVKWKRNGSPLQCCAFGLLAHPEVLFVGKKQKKVSKVHFLFEWLTAMFNCCVTFIFMLLT